MAALTFNQTGALSFISTILITVLLILCYTIDKWELVTYNRTKKPKKQPWPHDKASSTLETILENAGLNLTTKSGYFIVTLNSTTMVNGQEVNEQVALAQSLEAGMWKTCSLVPDEMMEEVDSFKGIELATNTCVHYNPLGQAPYPYASGPYLTFRMTRSAQSCMVVACICVLATLTLGAVSLIIKHVILSMIASTVIAASAMYQMLAMALMLKRQSETVQHLDVATIPISLEESMEIKFGVSTYIAVISFGLAVLSVALWVIHSKTLRGAIKLYVAETKYNLCCRT